MKLLTWRRTLIILLIIALVAAFFVIISSPMHQGGSARKVGGNLGVTFLGQPASARVITETTWNRKGKIRRWHHHFTRLSSAPTILAAGPRYTIEGETHGDSWAIDKVVQGICHFHITMSSVDHDRILDKYSGASCDHRETWLWNLRSIDKVTGAGWTSTWCLDPGQYGPCKPVEYRYWRFTFRWMQGVSIFGQDVAHHSNQWVACTLRGGGAGWSCNTGDVG